MRRAVRRRPYMLVSAISYRELQFEGMPDSLFNKGAATFDSIKKPRPDTRTGLNVI